MPRAVAGKPYIKREEYEQYPLHHFRDRNGNGYYVYMDADTDEGPVYVKQVADHVRIDKVTKEQWSNALLNHGMRQAGEDS
jgi:hypothetical protein